MATLNEKYALAWLEISTIVIFTLIGSLFYTLSNLQQFMSSSRSRLDTVCDAINSTSAQIYNAPTLLLDSSLHSIYAAQENIRRNLSTAVTVLENCLVWLIQMYKSTYRCLLLLAINCVIDIVTQIAGPLQSAAQSITSFVTGGGNYDVGNWTQSLTDTQTKLNTWFTNSNDTLQQVLDAPFGLLQTQINNTIGSWTPAPYNVSASLDPQVCNSTALIESLNHVENELHKSLSIAIGLLFLALLLCISVNIFMIHFRYHRVTQARATLLRLFRTTNDHQVLLDKYTWSSPIPFHKRQQPLYRFAVFMCHPIALYCFFVGVLGLLVTYGLIWTFETKGQQLYSEFSNTTQQWTIHATAAWTQTANNQFGDINNWIGTTEQDLNQHAFGVIQSTAMTLNDTLTTAVNEIQGLVNSIFGGTILEKPAMGLTQCLLLVKIQDVEKGLTWIVNHAYVNLSRIDVQQMDEIALGPKMQQAISDHIQVQDWSLSLPLRALVSFYTMLLVLWLICFFIALVFQIYYYKQRKDLVIIPMEKY